MMVAALLLVPKDVTAFLPGSISSRTRTRHVPYPYEYPQNKDNNKNNNNSLLPRDRVIRYYFDDISRKSTTHIPWTPDYIRQKTRKQVQEYADEKLEVLQKKLYGFDVDSASDLTAMDVTEEMMKWMKHDSFLLDSIPEAELSVELSNSVKVCQETTVIGCYAMLWETILDFTLEKKEKQLLQMVVFPHCPQMYNYDIMSYMNANIRSSYEFCSSLGDEYFVDLFHPRYENEPKMLSPEKHSPFPTFAIHDRNIIGNAEEDPAVPQELFHADIKYEGDGEFNYSSLRMKQNVEELEKLFNSGASSAQYSNAGISADSKDYQYVVDVTKDWIAKNSENKALRYSETIEDRWVVSNSDVGEFILCDIWSTIHNIQKEVAMDPEEEVSSTSSRRYHSDHTPCM